MSIVAWAVKHKLLATALGAVGIYVLMRPKSANAATIAATPVTPYNGATYPNSQTQAINVAAASGSGQQTLSQGWQQTPAAQQAMQENIAAAQQDVQNTKDEEGWAALGGLHSPENQ